LSAITPAAYPSHGGNKMSADVRINLGEKVSFIAVAALAVASGMMFAWLALI